MNKIILFLSAFLIIISTACKETKEATAPVDPGQTVNIEAPEKTDSLPALSRLVIVFFSAASGIDHKASKSLEELIATYSQEAGINVNYEKIPWGREGETDYCLELTELSPEQQADFVSRTRKLLETAEHVNIRENAPCRHRRIRE